MAQLQPMERYSGHGQEILGQRADCPV